MAEEIVPKDMMSKVEGRRTVQKCNKCSQNEKKGA